MELIDGVYGNFNEEKYKRRNSTCVFGSGVNNFGVRELLDSFVRIAPTPRSRNTEDRPVNPEEKKFSGFVFKIHANIDPNHRNRIAFLRICSGIFERNKFYYHVRLDKNLRFSSPATFMASEKILLRKHFLVM